MKKNINHSRALRLMYEEGPGLEAVINGLPVDESIMKHLHNWIHSGNPTIQIKMVRIALVSVADINRDDCTWYCDACNFADAAAWELEKVTVAYRRGNRITFLPYYNGIDENGEEDSWTACFTVPYKYPPKLVYSYGTPTGRF